MRKIIRAELYTYIARLGIRSRSTGDMAYVNALVFLLFIAYGNARNLSLVLVNDAVSEVGSCVPGAHWTNYSDTLCRESCALTAQHQATISERAVVVELISGSCI